MGKILGIEFAPLLIPIERRLQTLAVLYYCSEFLFIGFITLLFLLYLLLFTKFYFIPLLYLSWFLYDKNVCNQGKCDRPHVIRWIKLINLFLGGRISSWTRNWKLWKYYAGFFPLKLVKTHDLDPNKNYIIGSHPHGIMCAGAFGNFATEGTRFSEKFPGITPHILALEGQFWLPLHRELFLSSG